MKYILAALVVLLPFILSAQTIILDELIAEGLNSNLALRQQSLSLKQSVASLDKARGLFFPSLTIHARYSRAGGGRQIEFPVGTLLNPVYQSLNELYINAGQPPRPFPTLENEVIPFLRKEEHDTKIQLVQPIFQPAIFFNYRLRGDLVGAQHAAVAVFKRELIRDIQYAYFNYLSSVKLAELYRKTNTVLDENLRVSQSLFDAQKVTKDVVYRAQAELSALQEEALNAENQKIVAQSYLNFLVNRPLRTKIRTEDLMSTTDLSLPEFDFLLNKALNNREELTQLRLGKSAAGQQKSIAHSTYLPSISAVVDYGFQGEEYRFNGDEDFWMASFVLKWNLFNGFQDQAQLEIAQLEMNKIETQRRELEEQIKLQVRQAYDNCLSTLQRIEVAQNRHKSAKSSFNIIQKKYEQGLAAQIEFLDARQNFTNAEIGAILAKYNFFIDHAQLERVSALYEFSEKKEDK